MIRERPATGGPLSLPVQSEAPDPGQATTSASWREAALIEFGSPASRTPRRPSAATSAAPSAHPPTRRNREPRGPRPFVRPLRPASPPQSSHPAAPRRSDIESSRRARGRTPPGRRRRPRLRRASHRTRPRGHLPDRRQRPNWEPRADRGAPLLRAGPSAWQAKRPVRGSHPSGERRPRRHAPRVSTHRRSRSTRRARGRLRATHRPRPFPRR